MYKSINLPLRSKNRFKNLREDLAATLAKHQGLREVESKQYAVVLEGTYYLCNDKDELIEHFDIRIEVEKEYPRAFPVLYETGGKIKRHIDWHTNESGLTCVEIAYYEKIIAKRGISIYDFVEHYVHKFFCWQLVKDYGDEKDLLEWKHHDAGDIQFYEGICQTTDAKIIRALLNVVIDKKIPGRNDPCVCRSGHKSKRCHFYVYEYLQDIGVVKLRHDIKLFEIKS